MSLESCSFKPSAVLVRGPEASWGEKGLPNMTADSLLGPANSICQASINQISEKHVKD